MPKEISTQELYEVIDMKAEEFKEYCKDKQLPDLRILHQMLYIQLNTVAQLVNRCLKDLNDIVLDGEDSYREGNFVEDPVEPKSSSTSIEYQVAISRLNNYYIAYSRVFAKVFYLELQV